MFKSLLISSLLFFIFASTSFAHEVVACKSTLPPPPPKVRIVTMYPAHRVIYVPHHRHRDRRYNDGISFSFTYVKR
jgi:hypothetical protein